MDSLLAKLNADSVVLDLGCGHGSFHYEAYPFRTIATDLHLPPDAFSVKRPGVEYFQSESSTIPLAEGSVDAVICHNTLEHFDGYRETLAEIRRVLRPTGWLWIAVPNGNGLDDHLYRLVFEGGGHVNRFTLASLIDEVRTITGLQLLQTCDLFSSFVYLAKPTAEAAAGYPRTAHFLVAIPDGFHRFGVIALNTVTRLMDKATGSRHSQYGWGFVFARGEVKTAPLPSFFNVCRKCGSGCPASQIHQFGKGAFGLKPYDCPHCGELNVFVPPPPGLE